jgi:mono/diheme cytochrome c family protein
MRYAYYTLLFVVALVVSVMGFRGMRSTQPPVEVFTDMDRQAKYKPQGESEFFADGRADRPRVAGTVPRGRSEVGATDDAYLRADDARFLGRNADGSFVTAIPVEVTEAMINRGRERYMIYCAPCHGALGDGDGITKRYGMVATPTFHDDRIRNMPHGEIFNTITNGKNTMMPYGDKLTPDERWAVVAYVRALERARHAKLDDVPLEKRGELK